MKTLIIFFLLPLHVFAQPASPAYGDITGIWTGFINTTEKHLPYEVVISEDKGGLNGYSHIIFTVKGKEIISLKKIKLKKVNGNVLVEDDDLIYDNFSSGPPKKIRQFSNLSLKMEDSVMVLSGIFNTKKTREFKPASGNIRLQKKDTSTKTRIIPKLEEMDLLGTLSFLHPKIKEKEELAIIPAVAEEISPAPPKEKGIEIASSSVKVQEVPAAVLPLKKKIEIVSAPVPAKELPIVVQPKPTEVAKVTAPAMEKKPAIIPKPKPTDVVITKPPAIIKKLPASLPKQNEKQVVAVYKPPAVKQVQPVIKPPAKSVAINPSPPPATKPAPVSVASTPDITARKIETIQSVLFKADSLTLTLYDNGEVDGDSVSILLNGKVIISKQGLSTNAVTKTIYMTPDLGDSSQLVMYAENLGSIPPNTGLLIVQDGDDRYYIRFTGDLQKNAAVILRRKR